MRKLILITIFLSISNALFSQESNSECDSMLFLMVSEMPLYIGNYNMLLDNVSQQIDKETKSFLSNNNTNVVLQITCKGEARINSTSSSLTQFYNLLENELNKFKWIAGKQNGKGVNVQSTIPVRLFNNKLNIPLNFKEVKGELVKCRISDENSKMPISDVRLITKYNKCSYFSNQNGEVEFYCEAKDELEVSHINYQSFSFNAPENTNSFQIRLANIVYELETVDLTKYSPKKLPHKKSVCNFEDWQEKKQSQFVFLGLGDFYAPEMAVFNGGYECFYNYIVKEFVLAESAFENEYLDTVVISFTVAEDGIVKNIIFSKQLNDEIDTALNKLFIEMPKWKTVSC